MTDPATKAVSLPIVAWLQWCRNKRFHRSTRFPPLSELDLSMIEIDGDTLEALTPHAPAQAEIDRLRAQLQEQALQYLSDNEGRPTFWNAVRAALSAGKDRK